MGKIHTLKLLILLLLLYPFTINAAPIINYDGTNQNINLAKYLDELEDKNKAYTINDIVGKKANQFSQNQKVSINYQFSSSTYWLRFSLQNSTDTTQTFYVDNKISWIDSIKFYQQNEDGSFFHMEAGDLIPVKDRIVPHHNLVFPITLKAGEKGTYHLEIQGQDALQLPLFLVSEDQLSKDTQYSTYAFGAFFGVILIMAIYNFFIFLFIKERVYLWYTLYVITYGLFSATVEGISFEFIWTESIFWSERSVNLFLMGYFFFIILFTRAFLETKKNLPKVDVLLKLLAMITLIVGPSTLIISYPIAMQIGTYVATLIPFLLIGTGVVSYLNGTKMGIFYVIAWIPNSLLFLVYAFNFHGFIVYNNFTSNANDIGMLLEIMLLSLALAYRLRSLQKEKMKANEQLIIEQRAQTDRLNAMVEERTRELQEKNKELEELSITDQLTGLFNRRKLDNVFTSEIKRIQRYKHSLGIILIDIDNFKSINDTYGHQIGDNVLKTIADVLYENSRITDIKGRWGGEEFLIICPETDMNGVQNEAEKLRSKIESCQFPTVKSCTASFGVACYSMGDKPEQIVARADKALYIAKDNGRNRVECA